MISYDFLTKNLFTAADAQREIPSEPTLFATLKSLVKTGRIVKLKGGLYALVNPLTGDIFANRFEIATALHKGAFVGFHSALEFYGLGNQMYSDVHVFTPTQYRSDLIDGLEYVYFETKYTEGVSVVEQNSTVRVTELERTVVDCLNRPDVAGGLEEVFTALSAISYCDEQKLLKHLKAYDKKILYKKAGFFFSLLQPTYLTNSFFDVCKENVTQRFDDIRENKNASGKRIDEWKLIIPKEIVNTEN